MSARSWLSIVKDAASGTGIENFAVPPALSESVTIDNQLRARVKIIDDEFATASSLPHEPALVEPLLGDVAALLDRCLAYHRECSELEIKWVGYRLDSQLNQKLDKLDRELAVARLGRDVAQSAQLGYTTVAHEFGAVATDSPLAPGLAQEAKGAAQTSQVAVDLAARQEQLIHERFDAIRDYRAALEARYTAPGGAHNYLERYERISALLFEDFDEAYRKAKCASLGLQAIFTIALERIAFPELTLESSPGPIFRLVLWTRRMMREIEAMAESEIEFDFVLPLMQPFRDSDGPSGRGGRLGDLQDLLMRGNPIFDDRRNPPFGPESLCSKDLFTKSMAITGSGTLEFRVPDLFSRNHLRPRLVGIGLSFVVADASQPRLLDYRLSAALVPPKQSLPGRQSLSRPAIIFGNVYPHGALPIAFAQGLSIHNLQPVGEWKLLVHRYIVGGGITKQDRSEADIIDFRVHFKLVSRPKANISLGDLLEGPL